MESETHARPTGLQVAFLIFAVVLLAVPFQRYLGPMMGLGTTGTPWDRLYVFVPAIAILLAVPALRRYSFERLGERLIASRRIEVGVVSGAQVLFPLAIAGGIVLWYWLSGGEMALARRIGDQRSPAEEFARALTPIAVTGYLIMAGFVGPVIEELVFRGLLYDAWKARWGWITSIVATSLVFALYHPIPVAAFVSSVMFVLVMRRGGSIRASILAHMTFNLALWYPLLGQFYFITRGKETGEIHLWALHLGVLAGFAVVLPIYAWMARDDAAREESLEGDTVVAR